MQLLKDDLPTPLEDFLGRLDISKDGNEVVDLLRMGGIGDLCESEPVVAAVGDVGIIIQQAELSVVMDGDAKPGLLLFLVLIVVVLCDLTLTNPVDLAHLQQGIFGLCSISEVNSRNHASLTIYQLQSQQLNQLAILADKFLVISIDYTHHDGPMIVGFV